MIGPFKNNFRWLSNFEPCVITYEGLEYQSTEAAYQAAKTLDPEMKEQIRIADTPAKTKKLGKVLVLRPDWDTVKFSVMEAVLREKFNQPKFRNLLVSTQDEELVEKNHWHDNIWGSCTCAKCGDAGQNNLGKILMKIRQDLRS